MKEYPYQNHDLESLEGEQWKDIPGLEMYFQVSNYGRVKRLRYELIYSDGRKYLKPEKIIKPGLSKAHNKFKNDEHFFLNISVTLFKQGYNFSVARLVYFCFVSDFNMDDSSIVILSKDRNGLNIHPSNLMIASNRMKQQRMHDLKRMKPLELDEGAIQRAIAGTVAANRKKVSQYTLDGKIIKKYESLVMASEETGVTVSRISQIAKGDEFSAGGFIWRYGNETEIDLEPVLQKIAERKKRNKEIFGKKVTQYKMNGERIAIFPSLSDAVKATGILANEISRVTENKRASAGGFFWKKGYCEPLINLSDHIYGAALRSKKRSRAIVQYSKDGKLLRKFSSIKEAALAVGVDSASIIGALKGKQKTSAGYKWEYLKK